MVKATYFFHNANLRDLAGVQLSGAHLHFDGNYNLADLAEVDLTNTILILNPRGPDSPCKSTSSMKFAHADLR